ncbi:MAG: D-tyrosyl-tRNA(Tyr) deacylase [Saprospiraceae bacterium]|nr:D-tyrosyl-tRNA(Tyr) deacylase [Saprospiraceae bacterium]
MRAILQRVSQASVTIDQVVTAEIGVGLLILLGIEEQDNNEDDIQWLCRKIVQMRIFSDENGLMNKSIEDINGEMLVVSQFTLFASTKKGNRPSFIRAAKPTIAIPLYEEFLSTLQTVSTLNVKAGTFGADMKINLCNDGPVTIFIDTKNKE